MSTIALGPLMIRADILVFLISAVMGFLVLKVRLRGREESGWMLDTYVNALIIGFVVWKFSMIVFDPIRTIQHPSSLLYFTGGDQGIWLGTALALAYVGVRLNKKRSLVVLLVKAAMLAFLTGGFARHVFLWFWDESLGEMALMYALLHGVLAVWAWIKYDASIRIFGSIALWYSIGSVLIPFFDEGRNTVVAGFTSVQIAFGVLAFAILIFDMLFTKQQNKTADHR
ncbi:hypothetical protein MNQ98_18620 [Paenibacillus sp. N3/727]|uniref:hypothetical protein n=1 Tax=Paenibacillus sp. N3/727 TaxID=2925845 RepID=UPI001F534F26|nr:hypothetical protein [Paenibacillus sp. N3/727]UNK16509.1 hypothetical protein MNQ98_18620 [Paenibacillus sp. N3/727]